MLLPLHLVSSYHQQGWRLGRKCNVHSWKQGKAGIHEENKQELPKTNWYPRLSLTISNHGDRDGTHDKLALFPPQLLMHLAQNSKKLIQQEDLQQDLGSCWNKHCLTKTRWTSRLSNVCGLQQCLDLFWPTEHKEMAAASLSLSKPWVSFSCGLLGSI